MTPPALDVDLLRGGLPEYGEDALPPFPSFVEGERLRFLVKADRDTRIAVLEIAPTGEVHESAFDEARGVVVHGWRPRRVPSDAFPPLDLKGPVGAHAWVILSCPLGGGMPRIPEGSIHLIPPPSTRWSEEDVGAIEEATGCRARVKPYRIEPAGHDD